ncbi:MAG: homoserine O-acetyltransferase [Acidimicrobiia bacterium]|nr:homoserine O-acetyltransferase [Acidimicrobiia bacterium]
MFAGEPLPVSGAWQPGDEPGGRRFATVVADRALQLEGGDSLATVTVAYETWGTLDADGANAVLVCHALTGDSHAAGPAGAGHPTPGWWDDLIGPGRAIDTDRWFVVCANVLGGCQGTTGPASIDPATGRPYGARFPAVTVRDMVRTQQLLAEHLGVGCWLAAIGGSMGGMQVIEWAVMFPHRVRGIVPIATAGAASAQQIAWSAVERRAIALDPRWRGGDYYDAPEGEGPSGGLALAREIAQITYRTHEVFDERFGRTEHDPLDCGFRQWQRFDVEAYLDYHGTKLVRRFDANSYLALSKAMDLHDLGRKRGGLSAALRRVRARSLTMSIDSDALYPPAQQYTLCDGLKAAGARCDHVEIHSPQGHDGFLLEPEQVGPPIADLLESLYKETDRHG